MKSLFDKGIIGLITKHFSGLLLEKIGTLDLKIKGTMKGTY